MVSFIYNEITDATAAAIATQIEQIDALEINSNGGSVFAALAILNNLFFLHSPQMMMMGHYDAAKLAEMQTTLEKIETQIKEIYSARVKDVDLSKETWLTANEAKAMGLIDEIEGSVEVTAQNELIFTNKCVFAAVANPQAAVTANDVAAEILAVIKDQLASGALGVAGSVPPVDETERRINLVANYANGVR